MAWALVTAVWRVGEAFSARLRLRYTARFFMGKLPRLVTPRNSEITLSRIFRGDLFLPLLLTPLSLVLVHCASQRHVSTVRLTNYEDKLVGFLARRRRKGNFYGIPQAQALRKLFLWYLFVGI